MAWCIATTEGQILLEGGGLLPGNLADQGSYCSEAGGILGSITVCERVEKIMPPVSKYAITVACDGESALYQCLSQDPDKVSSFAKHADLISRIQDRKKKLNCQVTPVHVKGHQNEVQGLRSLSMMEILNVKMDDLANRVLK